MPAWQAIIIGLAIGLVIGIIITSTTAEAIERQCDSFDGAMQTFKSEGYTRVGGGVTGNKRGVVSVYITKAGGWLVALTRTDGITCIQGIGEDWQGEAPCWGDGI